MGKRIMCISCKHATADKQATEGKWTAYECSNADSEFYKALVNVGVNGEMHKKISWSGCKHGVRGKADENKGFSAEGVQDGNPDQEQIRANRRHAVTG